MRKQQKSILVLVTITIFVMTTTSLPGLVRAGSLEPSDSPGPTMHTLDEIYNIVLDTNSKVGDGQCEGAPVAKTGQTTSYADGDDGNLEKGVAWPAPRFTDNEDGTVTDNLTGLIWLKNANCFGLRTWTQALSDCNNLADGSCGLTDGSSAGDWRLPNVRELQSLIDYGRYNPALSNTSGLGQWEEGDPFINVQNVQPACYWSSTRNAPDPSGAWIVSLYYGYVGFSVADVGNYVWCVRGGQ